MLVKDCTRFPKLSGSLLVDHVRIIYIAAARIISRFRLLARQRLILYKKSFGWFTSIISSFTQLVGFIVLRKVKSLVEEDSDTINTKLYKEILSLCLRGFILW